MPWLTPSSLPVQLKCRQLVFPDDLHIQAAISGALLNLCHAYNWEQFGSVTPDEMATAMIEMLANGWEDCMPASFAPVLLYDQKAANADGGTFNSGAWRIRDLNVLVDVGSLGVTLDEDEFTLPEGLWLIEWSAPARLVTNHQTRLWSVTENTVVGFGSSGYCPNADNQDRSFGALYQNNSSPTTYRLEHRCIVSRVTDGFGVAANLANEIYTQIKCSLLELP